MKSKLLVGLLVAASLFSTPAFSETPENSVPPKVDIRGNIVILQDRDYELVVPLGSIISVRMDRSSKEYVIVYYGYYTDSATKMRISKEEYEKLKRHLIKSEQ